MNIRLGVAGRYSRFLRIFCVELQGDILVFLRSKFEEKGFLRLLERGSCYRWNIFLGKVPRRA